MSRVASLAPSASAPDLRRGRLEALLTKAGASSELSRSGPAQRNRRPPPGGAPYANAPPVRATPATASRRNNVSFPEEDVLMVSHGVDRAPTPVYRESQHLLRASRTSSMPALAARHPTATNFRENSSRIATPNSKKAGSYVKQLVGDDDGENTLHWRLVQEMDAIDGLVQENAERLKVQEQKARQRALLQEQVREAKAKDNEYRSSMAKWGGKLQADADKWQSEEKMKKAATMEANRIHNEAQARHAEDGRRRRQEEANTMARLEKEMANQASEAKRRQEEADDRKKMRQQEIAKQMADAARDAVQQKALAKQEEARKDIEIMRQQQAMQDEQERRRAEGIQKIRDKQGKAQAQFEAGAGNQMARLQKQEEDRAKRYQEERNAKDEAAFQEKQRKLKQMQMDGAAFISKQLQEHADLKAAEREEQRKRRERSDQDAAAAMDDEKKKAQERRQREKENAEYLQRQINLKSASKLAGEQMTEVERSMNKDRLERARKPENLQLLFKSKQGQFSRADEVEAPSVF